MSQVDTENVVGECQRSDERVYVSETLIFTFLFLLSLSNTFYFDLTHFDTIETFLLTVSI